MKERILTGWTFTRVFYLIAGIFLIVHSLNDGQWFGVVFGGYFTAMGLFAFGCASGTCYPGVSPKQSRTESNVEVSDVTFEEVKQKQDGTNI